MSVKHPLTAAQGARIAIGSVLLLLFLSAIVVVPIWLKRRRMRKEALDPFKDAPSSPEKQELRAHGSVVRPSPLVTHELADRPLAELDSKELPLELQSPTSELEGPSNQLRMKDSVGQSSLDL